MAALRSAHTATFSGQRTRFVNKLFIKWQTKQEQITAPFNNMRTLKFEAQPTKWVFRCRQSSVRRLILASDYCRALFRYLNCAQRFDYRTLDSSRKLGGVAEHLIDCSEKFEC